MCGLFMTPSEQGSDCPGQQVESDPAPDRWATNGLHDHCDEPAYFGIGHTNTNQDDASACLSELSDGWIQLDLGVPKIVSVSRYPRQYMTFTVVLHSMHLLVNVLAVVDRDVAVYSAGCDYEGAPFL